MPGLSPLSPLTLPWATLKLLVRFALPLSLWFTLGELLRYGVMYGGYRLGRMHGLDTVVPIVALSLLVMISLLVAVAMMHSLREGLDAVHAREGGFGEDDGDLAPWAVGNEETAVDALGRVVLPFMIFYLAWGWFGRDAQEFYDEAAGRGFGEGSGHQLEGMRMLLTLQKHLFIAVALTIAFFVAKAIAERTLETRVPRAAGLVIALMEVNFALFGIFTIDELRGRAAEWISSRQAWGWVTDVAGGVLELWEPFKFAVLGSLVWLVIAGVILGVDAQDEEIVLGRSRAARRVAQAVGVGRERSAREVVTRELRDMWLPTWYGMRLVRHSGLVPFAVFAALYTSLDVLEELTQRTVYELLGPHSIAWWMTWLHPAQFFVDLLFQAIRICLLAAAFNLVVARVSGRNAAKAVSPSADIPSGGAPPERSDSPGQPAGWS